MADPIDPVALTAALVRCNSVTPLEGGALVLLEDLLSGAGFICTRVDRGGISNLFARWGVASSGPTLAFNGHTDVVPVGDPDAWTHDPFGGEIHDGFLFGRGAADMKSGVAAFAAAAADFVQSAPPTGSVVLAITGDEEADAIDGTIALIDWMTEQGERIDHCLVGEPTCREALGDAMKIGRRGSMTAYLSITGVQGHAAYPERAVNPVPIMAKLINALSTHQLDDGTAHFDPSTLAVTTIDTGNPATNVIPSRCGATVNIRFNDAHSSAELKTWMTKVAGEACAETGTECEIEFTVSGESFFTPPGWFSKLVAGAVETETGRAPILSTAGGTSDARFVKDVCPVVEFGLVGKTMHQVDECVAVEQIGQLTTIYGRILKDYFA